LQLAADFLANGPVEAIPADVLAEMRAALSIDSSRHRR
jgi:hypothetical protein